MCESKAESPVSDLEMRKPRFLCLHGFRTNSDILILQTYALREELDIDCVFIDAPHEATGPPDALIKTYFPNESYYEWHGDRNTCTQSVIDDSTEFILQKYIELGPFDGILGFSQGAEMASRVALKLDKTKIKCLILFSGVVPTNIEAKEIISIPSLHIISPQDHLYEENKRLEDMYSLLTRTTLVHCEGHKIPSAETALYPSIQSWLSIHIRADENDSAVKSQ
eukprot:gene9532-19825_t